MSVAGQVGSRESGAREQCWRAAKGGIQASLSGKQRQGRGFESTIRNDYNDGSMTDNMSLQIAKSVYRALGGNGDDFVKFNTGNYVSKGDPHGAAGAAIEGKYLSDFFFDTRRLTAEEEQRLNADPYLLKASNGRTQSPYDYYWGGFNTITGGKRGVDGRDGWYFHDLESGR